MRNQLVAYLLFFSVLSYSQEKRKVINGYTYVNKVATSDIHVVNKNSNQGTITNNLGLFEIPVFVGDTLVFSHINLVKKEITITKDVLFKEIIKINIEEKTYSLNEIILEKPKNIFYVDPEIMPAATVNAKTLNLPYADTFQKKDYTIFKIKSGAVISFDNLLNALNGNNKRRKELEKITLEDDYLTKIRKHFTDDFFITDLKIKQENINPFLNHCFKKNIIYLFKNNNKLKLTRILMEESKSFPKKNNIEISLLRKN